MSAPSKRSGLNRLRWRVAAFYRHRLGELSAEIAVRSELTEECLAQRLRLFSTGIGLPDLRCAAFNRGAQQIHRGHGGNAKGNEERRIVNVDLNFLIARIDRVVERQCQVEREDALVGVEIIVLRRLPSPTWTKVK